MQGVFRYNDIMILGIDEVGRGPWAGPLVVGAVVLEGANIKGLTDSKKLSKKRREELDVIIRAQASGIGLGWVSASEIDKIGLSAALKLATIRAVTEIKTFYDEIIIDGTVNFLAETNKGQYVTTLKKADLLIPSVSAASVVAKVARDNYMTEQDAVYEGYGFKSHVGYGTAAHSAAIEKLGVTPLHRLSFAPLVEYRSRQQSRLTSRFQDTKSEVQPKGTLARNGILKTRYREDDLKSKLTTKQVGDIAETEVANYLAHHGHKIINRNWKTKYCEIDIISKKLDTIYFTEVKYRKTSQQGGGLAAITSKKLRQMKFAAQLYSLRENIVDVNLRLSVASVTGTPPEIQDFLEIE
jgi:ribonuclease HII